MGRARMNCYCTLSHEVKANAGLRILIRCCYDATFPLYRELCIFMEVIWWPTADCNCRHVPRVFRPATQSTNP
jgi:hypothetical protein